MEPEHKSLATASSQTPCPDGRRDRFTSLPDEIAHEILSRVSFGDLTRVGAVSKKCNEFSLSTPSLRFDSYDNMKRKAAKMNCFEEFLHRRGNNKIQHLSINLSFPEGLSSKVSQVMRWLDTATMCNVEELDLVLLMGSIGNSVECPFSLFSSTSLKSLWVSLKIFKVPSFPCPNNLQRLSLCHTTLDEGFSQWISTSCKRIKELILYYVQTESLMIDNSSLELLTFDVGSRLRFLNISGEKLKSIHIKWECKEPGNRVLHISAPILKYLRWFGNLVTHPKLGKFLCLEEAKIFLEAKSYCVCDSRYVLEVLRSICTAQALILSSETIKIFFEEGTRASPMFDTSYLRINTASLSNDLVPLMVFLMRGMPNLNTLEIKSDSSLLVDDPKASGYNGKYWQSQSLDFVNQLKEVTIELLKGNNGWQLARFILEHAQNLKKMTIFCPPRRSNVIKQKILINSKNISSAKIDFHEKRWR